MDKPQRPSDLNQLAKAIVDQAAGNGPPAKAVKDKNPAAVTLGRLGGLKGGKARAKSLTPEQRHDIAKKAANSRWSRPKPEAE
jgi:hypothetical protein